MRFFWCITINPRIRLKLANNGYRTTRRFGRGIAFSLVMAACILLFGRTPRYCIYWRPAPKEEV